MVGCGFCEPLRSSLKEQGKLSFRGNSVKLGKVGSTDRFCLDQKDWLGVRCQSSRDLSPEGSDGDMRHGVWAEENTGSSVKSHAEQGPVIDSIDCKGLFSSHCLILFTPSQKKRPNR